ncbi:hypothetical protein OPU71_05795 [Niveibacterium sp. 24ML]|uniref:hypothetical protein n=1 Tax=Niveibacterium sp. 24ML TaxID=2985512 RepID=UPI002271B8DE|nr:hypothetical protein [Niveibacterium sp. 24ML]MCX9155635.1 hypothetical protein [Niveibacterium sp. 24ML]
MSEFDLSYYDEEAAGLALEIERKLVILNLDWTDPTVMRMLAKEVLAANNGGREIGSGAEFSRDQTCEELFGLIALMNKLMCEAAEKGVEVHGNDAWKAVARALWLEKEEREANV